MRCKNCGQRKPGVHGPGRRMRCKGVLSALDRLAISPQWGFASDVVGNLLSEDDQKASSNGWQRLRGRCGDRPHSLKARATERFQIVLPVGVLHGRDLVGNPGK